jgi:hypothetical protein
MKTARAAARFVVPLILLMALSTVAVGGMSQPFPHVPDPQLTLGSLCDEPDEFRYRERIPYCKRDVDRRTKEKIIKTYDQLRGYRISHLKRHKFKIDHYIPLCAGGSNDIDNLWPQHESVYEVTDPLEQRVCERLSQGLILQKEAIELIRIGKNNLEQVQGILSHLEDLENSSPRRRRH